MFNKQGGKLKAIIKEYYRNIKSYSQIIKWHMKKQVKKIKCND